LARSVDRNSRHWPEAHGLMGRAWKQIFLDAPDKESPEARNALKEAIRHYRIPYKADPKKNVWHAVNILALTVFARNQRLKGTSGINPRRLAQGITEALDKTPRKKRDLWYHASRAEALFALDNFEDAERQIGLYASDEDTTAFALGGTLRQLTELWQFGTGDERQRGLVQTLKAALLKKDGATLNLAPDELKSLQREAKPDEGQLERILGNDGPRTFEWWRQGLASASSVAAVCQTGGGRVGTGFLVRGGDFDPELGDRPCILTNAHVVSEDPDDRGIDPTEAQIRLEATDAGKSYAVQKIHWSSGVELLDASLLCLNAEPEGVKPLRMAPRLPLVDGKQRVYVIGHPDGGELSFSLQDNILLDHEGPTNGKPSRSGVRRMHYRAPTESGSSGSPVFNEDNWAVIALHHAGGQLPKLNQQPGKWDANEGLCIQSIVKAAQLRKEVADE
jgi:S1-C subfamily serine protease